MWDFVLNFQSLYYIQIEYLFYKFLIVLLNVCGFDTFCQKVWNLNAY